MLIDLHTHSRALSWDSDLSLDELIERAQAKGLDGICLTEHDYFWDAQELRSAGQRHGFIVLPGVEINTEEGHFLCFGIERYVYGMHRWGELAEHIRGAGGAMIAAHPYRRQMPWRPERESAYSEALARARANPAYAACVAMELVNGRGSDAENGFAARLCEATGLAGVAGSDAHELRDIGRCATEFDDRIEDLEGLIAALRAGRFRAVSLTNGARGEGSIIHR
jgi:predicted metal-dependent phosphoesterase TrpH